MDKSSKGHGRKELEQAGIEVEFDRGKTWVSIMPAYNNQASGKLELK